MVKGDLKRFRLRDQLSADCLKIFALFEKTVLAIVLITLVFILMEKAGLTNVFWVGGVAGGTIGFLIITVKKMYHDEALSELKVHDHIKPEMLSNAMLTIGYSEKKDGMYHPKIKLFSIFFYCPSELIMLKAQGVDSIFTGPYDKLLKLSNTISRDVSS
ncbi:hypothetical protein PCAU_3380 [Pseudomonas chlororaphis subsp. aurantiaca]|uniref:hypothetical protein n=1 Tax=Pseudomonas chlororaphis TaxID=587753 RepID=UPI000864B137|nr:hypothetical protein [Pseudomonas chlororaphis]BAV75589.1 hypothetical protein PCAU_3380 [Pseudomonas chlororaphis subsp. aurantiaca]